MSDSSEEKNLPPSEHKLRKAREKGEVAASSDFVTAMVVTTTILFLAFSWPSFVQMISALFHTAISSMGNVTPQSATVLLTGTLSSLAQRLTMLGLIIMLVAIVANIIHKRGVPISMHPIIPDFKRINPSSGFEKLFSARNATEFGISLVRTILWFVIAGIILWLALGGLLRAVQCGAGCLLEESFDTGRAMVIVALIMLIIAGLLDLPLQTALFKRDQRMSHSEAKRERKDTMGNAEFKAHRRGQYRSLIDENPGSDISFYLAGPDFLVGISYDPAKSNLPRVVSRVRDQGYEAGIKRAKKNGIPVVRQPDLAADIFRTIDVGNIIRERHFERVAMILLQLGMVGRG